MDSHQYEVYFSTLVFKLINDMQISTIQELVRFKPIL